MPQFTKIHPVEAVPYKPGMEDGHLLDNGHFFANGRPIPRYKGKTPVIQSRHGFLKVHVGDWIITETNGDKHPCSDEVFRERYAPV